MLLVREIRTFFFVTRLIADTLNEKWKVHLQTFFVENTQPNRRNTLYMKYRSFIQIYTIYIYICVIIFFDFLRDIFKKNDEIYHHIIDENMSILKGNPFK